MFYRFNKSFRAGMRVGTFIGSTSSTASPTLSSGVSSGSSPNGSPFSSSVNSYYWTASGSSPYRYISVPGSSSYAFGTSDFTIEWFQYQTDANSFPRYFWYGGSPSIGLSIEGASYTSYLWNGANFTSLGNQSNNRNSWIHYALVRISGVVKFYRDGTQVGNSANWSTNITDTSSTFYFGTKANTGLASEQFGGSLTSIRICKGVGVYTGNFTKPTSKLGQTQSANPYGGTNTSAIISGQCSLLLNP